MKLQLGLRMEIHDSRCRRCDSPKPSNRPCFQCGIEDANVASAGTGSIGQVIDRVEAARNQRRKENR